jgi:hypothetical protein
MPANPGHVHDWRTRRRTNLTPVEGYGGSDRFVHDMTCDCGAQLTQPDRDHPEPETHEWIGSSIHEHCHWIDAEWRCGCGAVLVESLGRDPDSSDFGEHRDPRCSICNALATGGWA